MTRNMQQNNNKNKQNVKIQRCQALEETGHSCRVDCKAKMFIIINTKQRGTARQGKAGRGSHSRTKEYGYETPERLSR